MGRVLTVAAEIRAFTLAIPAGTPSTAPITLDVSFPPRRVDTIEVVVPSGPSGVVGWAVLNAGVRMIPYLSDPWIITSGETISWPLERQVESGSWQVSGYNTGTNAHSVYFRFLLSLTTDKAPPPTLAFDSALINAQAPDLGQ